MKVLKYLLHILIFMIIYIATVFIAATVVSSRAGVCVVLGLVTALAMIYLWYVAKGKFFTVPIAFMIILALAVFYFNHPENPDMGLGMWVVAKYLVVPYLAGSLVAAIIMAVIQKTRKN